MELDDIAEKARRNLMMVSTGILAVWALGIPLDGKLVGAVDLSAVDPWRAWLTALVVLVYFTLRYHFAPIHSATPKRVDELQAWKARRKNWFEVSRDQELQSALADTACNGTPNSNGSKFVFCFPSKPEGKNAKLLKTDLVKWNGRRGTLHSRWAQMLEEPIGPGTTNIIGPRFISEEQETRVAIRRRAYVRMHFEAWKHAYQPSWNLLELSIPWFLAAGALIVCIWRIAASIYFSFPFVRQLLST